MFEEWRFEFFEAGHFDFFKVGVLEVLETCVGVLNF